jgi:hypothetical protein
MLDSSTELKWPSVSAAYDFVIPSYTLLVSRFEAADTRLTNLLTFGATITLGAPIFAKAVQPAISFRSSWFILAMAAFLLSASIGLVARVCGALTLPNPMLFYQHSLHETDWAFRKNAIYFAGEHFGKNARAIRVKGTLALVAAASIIAEILSFVLWIAQASNLSEVGWV